MSLDLWIGTLISIPVALGGALAAPHVQNWMDKRGQKTHAKRRERIKEEYEEALHYALHTDMLIGHMLVLISRMVLLIVITIIIWTTFPGLAITLAAFIQHHSTPASGWGVALLAISTSGWIATGIGYIVSTSRLVSRYARIFFNVRFLKTYLKSIPDDLRDLGMERIVLCAARERAIPTSSWKSICNECRRAHDGKPPCESKPPAQIEATAEG